MAVTTIEELKAKKYIEVNLPGWDIDDIFTCKLQRVNLLDLAAKGKIPNPLMGPVIELFNGKGPEPDSKESMKNINDLAELFCEVTMVEPKFKEVQEIIGMTDEQKVLIYNFAVHGVKALEPFLKRSKDNESSEHGATIQGETKQINEDRR